MIVPNPISAAVLALVPDVVNALVASPKVSLDSTLDLPTLTNAVIGLFLRNGSNPLVSGTSGTAPTADSLASMIISALQGLQKNGQGPAVQLSQALANLLTQRCSPPIGGAAVPAAATAGTSAVASGVDPIQLLYTVDPKIPKVGGVDADLWIGRAAQLWQHALPDQLNIEDVTDEPAKANINVVWEPLDNLATLGSTDVGGPGRMKGPLQLRLNSDITDWTPFLFVGAASHEFGHAMGFGFHLPDEMALMNATINEQVDQPDDVDVQSLKKIWGFDRPGAAGS